MDIDKKNYYEVLEIPVNASPQDIEKAYVRSRNAYSGDSVALYSLMTNQECAQILEQIEEAYAVLGFPEKRREYDRVRGFNQISRHPFEESSRPQAPLGNPVPHHQQQSYFQHQPVQETPPETSPKNEMQERGPFQYEDYAAHRKEAKVSKVQALKKFGLEFEVDAAMEERIEQNKDFSGPFLKQVREYKNVTMERMVEMTRISRSHLDAIENDNLAKLPADVYTRGFVAQYAKILKLNPELVATSYLHHIKRLKGGK